MVIISVCNTKGGCGKTSISGGIAGAYAKRGKKVLLIDADPQGGITTVFSLGSGVDVENSITSVFTGESRINDVIVKTKIHGVWGIASAKQLEPIGAALEFEEDYITLLAEALKEVEKSYDYIVIDAPNSNSPIMENVAFASDIILVPFEGVQSVQRIGDLENVLFKTRPEADYIRINLYNALSSQSDRTVRRAVDEEFEKYGISKPEFEIRRSSPMALICNEGGSICHYRPKSLAGMDIMALTYRIEEKLGITKVTDKTVSEILAEAASNE